MATKTFSGRAEDIKLEYAEAVTQEQLGMSFGQYCASTVIDYINATGSLPVVEVHDTRQSAIDRMFNIADKYRDASKSVAQLSDAEVRELLAARYE